MSGNYDVLLIDGDLEDWSDNIGIGYLRYYDLNKQEVEEICAAGFKQGFIAVIFPRGELSAEETNS